LRFGILLLLLAAVSGHGATSFVVDHPVADAFLASGSIDNPAIGDLSSLNFGGAATLAIASGGSPKGEFSSVVKFNFSDATAAFDSVHGAGNWEITAVTISLASNFGTPGAQPNNSMFNPVHAGGIGIDWLSQDAWVEGVAGSGGSAGFPATTLVSFNSISFLFSGSHESLGSYPYDPPGNNVYVDYPFALAPGFLADMTAGGDVSLYLYATDDEVSFLFNARSFASNRPRLTVTAAPIPEPSSAALTVIMIISVSACCPRRTDRSP